MEQSFFKRWFADFEFLNEDGKYYKSSGREIVESEILRDGKQVILKILVKYCIQR